jgi:hypothetical protein
MTTRRMPPATGHVHNRRGRSLNSRVIQLSAFALSFILIALLVVTSSRAAFVAQNDNVANTVTSASIDLTDNDNAGAMFNVSGLMPGVNEIRCITVTYTGTVNPTAVRLYRSAVPSNDLAPYLNLTIESGAPIGTAFSGCTGFTPTNLEYSGTLDGFATSRTGYGDAPALTAWDPTVTGEARTFRFTVNVQDVPAAEGKTTTFGFQWETRTS